MTRKLIIRLFVLVLVLQSYPLGSATSWFTPQGLGATCDGLADDTSYIQAAGNSAVAVGGVLYNPGICRVNSTGVAFNGRLHILGNGYSGYGGSSYTGLITSTAGMKGSVFICDLAVYNCITINSDNAPILEKFQVSFLSAGPPTGQGAAFSFNSSAPGHAMKGMVIRDVLVTGANYCVLLNDAYDFVIDNINCINGWVGGIQMNAGSYPSFGDSVVTHSTFWGNGVPSYAWHAQILSGGGLRFTDNKTNYGSGTNTISVLVVPNLSVPQTVEPLIISGNSFEGNAIAVDLNNGNIANGLIALVIVEGNQGWTGLQFLNVNTQGTGQWIGALKVRNNIANLNGGANKLGMFIDNAFYADVGGNTVTCSGGCTTSTGIQFGANVSSGKVDPNVFDFGVTKHVVNPNPGVVIADDWGMLLADGPAAAKNGSRVFFSDAVPGSSPCASGGVGSTAFRQNGAWKCF